MNVKYKKWYISIIIVVSITTLSGYSIWKYQNSFKDITFLFNDKNGIANLSSNDYGRINIVDNQTVRLKKGEYILNTHGKDIVTKSKTIQINDASNEIKVSFNYTPELLDKIYQKEKDNILSDLYSQYPKIKSHYTISGGAVYERGQFYGAKLTYKQTKDENRDSLRVLMQKQSSGEWKVLSNPPKQVLSAPDYPSVQYETLRSINQVK